MKAEKAKPADNLTPCPFCGSSGDRREIMYVDWLDAPEPDKIPPETNLAFWGVGCVACNATSPNADSRHGACQRWNQRITETAVTEQNLKLCPFCGASGNKLIIRRGDWRGVEKLFEIPPESNPVFYGVSCLACLAGGPLCDTRREARNRWNERPS